MLLNHIFSRSLSYTLFTKVIRNTLKGEKKTVCGTKWNVKTLKCKGWGNCPSENICFRVILTNPTDRITQEAIGK